MKPTDIFMTLRVTQSRQARKEKINSLINFAFFAALREK
jgi:hypothetical protein